jgi:hypothetical protein
MQTTYNYGKAKLTLLVLLSSSNYGHGLPTGDVHAIDAGKAIAMGDSLPTEALTHEPAEALNHDKKRHQDVVGSTTLMKISLGNLIKTVKKPFESKACSSIQAEVRALRHQFIRVCTAAQGGPCKPDTLSDRYQNAAQALAALRPQRGIFGLGLKFKGVKKRLGTALKACLKNNQQMGLMCRCHFPPFWPHQQVLNWAA